MCLFVFVGGAVLAKGVLISMMKFYGNNMVGWRASMYASYIQRNPPVAAGVGQGNDALRKYL
jgi:hypothetical protein